MRVLENEKRAKEEAEKFRLARIAEVEAEKKRQEELRAAEEAEKKMLEQEKLVAE